MASVQPINDPVSGDDDDNFLMPALPSAHVDVAGYESLGIVPPPAENFDYNQIANIPKPEFTKTTHVDEFTARQALAQFVSEHCCYGSGPVKELEFHGLSPSETYRYILETFTESRTTGYKAVPYRGALIMNDGNPPGPWEIPCTPSCLHESQDCFIEIPNTSRIEQCTRCQGSGTVVCSPCHGQGRRRCNYCFGSGSRGHSDGRHERCTICGGMGQEMCVCCHGNGRRRCGTCDGTGNLRWFIELKVSYVNHESDFLKDTVTDDIPDEVIREAQAEVVFTEQNLRVTAINHHEDQDINKASVNLINTHTMEFGNMKILGQRHHVTVTPITLCRFIWDEIPGDYYVYGLDHKVWAPNYPKKCCCTIL